MRTNIYLNTMKNCRKWHDRQIFFHYWYNFVNCILHVRFHNWNKSNIQMFYWAVQRKFDRSTSCRTAGGKCRSLYEILNRYNNETCNDGKLNSRTNVSQKKKRLKGRRHLLSGKFVELNCSSRFYGPSRFNKNAWCPQTK